MSLPQVTFSIMFKYIVTLYKVIDVQTLLLQKSVLTCHTNKLPYGVREFGSYTAFGGVAQNNCGTGLTKYGQHCSQASCSS